MRESAIARAGHASSHSWVRSIGRSAAQSDFALTLALGLNELATNAAKYGALASPTGRITLTARLEAGQSGDEFRLVWQEDGGPAVDAPTVAGFGTSMLSQAIEYQHEGKVELDWRKQGLICRVTLPIAKAVTGMVTAADPQTQKISIEDQTFVMKEGGGAALFPQVGSEVTLSYKEDGGQKVITRIGQKQQ